MLMAKTEGELKSLLMRVKEENQKVDLKLTFQNTKIMASSPITSKQIGGDKVEAVIELDAKIFIFWMLSFKLAFSTLLFHLHQEDP